MLSSRASGLMLVRGRVEPWLAPPPRKEGGGRRGWRGGEVGGEEGMDAVRVGDG